MTPNLWTGARNILMNERGPHVSAIVADLANDIRADDHKAARELERAGKKLFDAWFGNDPREQGDATADVLRLVDGVIKANSNYFDSPPQAQVMLKMQTDALAMDPLTGLSDPVALQDPTIRANWLSDIAKGALNAVTGGIGGTAIDLFGAARDALQGNSKQPSNGGIAGYLNSPTFTPNTGGVDYAGQIQNILNQFGDPNKGQTGNYGVGSIGVNTYGQGSGSGGDVVRHSNMELLFGPLLTPAIPTTRFTAPRGYVVCSVALNHPYANDIMASGGVKVGDKIKIAVQKKAAKDFHIWKPRAKPPVTAAQARTIQKAHTLEKKIGRLAAKAGVTVSQTQVNRANKR